MKAPFKKTLLQICIALLLSSCLKPPLEYYKGDHIGFYNQSDTIVYVKFKFLKHNLDTFGLKNPNNRNFNRIFKSNGFYNTVRLDTSNNNMLFHFEFNKIYIKNIWLSEKEFNNYVSNIQIYKLKNTDTIFVNNDYYNSIKKWNYSYFNQPLYYPRNDSSFNHNLFIIKKTHFAK